MPSNVVIYDVGRYAYPANPPFHPPEHYPEYPFASSDCDPDNHVYAAVREMLYTLGCDSAHFGLPEWNPLGELIKPGDNVVLKPNFVISEHPLGLRGIQASVVHGSILRPLVDYAYIANQGRGSIAIVDSPIKEVEFEKTLLLTGMGGLRDFYAALGAFDFRVVDLRDLFVERNAAGVMIASKRLQGDAEGYRLVDLGQKSMLAEVAEHAGRYRSTAAYYENVMSEFHDAEHNIYSLPRTILDADVVISVAKLKTHRKAGVTLSMKNMIGLTNEKRGLPHHRYGTPEQGGDIFAKATRVDVKARESLKDLFIRYRWGRYGMRYIGQPLQYLYSHAVKPALDRMTDGDHVNTYAEGDWYGNDTIWRTVLDLNTILLYADREGRLQPDRQRRYLSVIDGILAGDKEGPLLPTPKECGVLVAGDDGVAVDITCAQLMGFDYHRIPTLFQAAARDAYRLGVSGPSDITVLSNSERWRSVFDDQGPRFDFEPSAGWKGYIERMK